MVVGSYQTTILMQAIEDVFFKISSIPGAVRPYALGNIILGFHMSLYVS